MTDTTEAGQPAADCTPAIPLALGPKITGENSIQSPPAPDRDDLLRLARALRTPLDVELMLLPGFDGVPEPDYKHDGDAGMDLRAAFPDAMQSVAPGAMVIWPTGIAVSIPFGWVMDVRSKSGRTRKQRLVISNAPGTIDAPYTGPVELLVENRGTQPVDVARLEAVAQLVLLPVQLCRFKRVTQFSRDSSRGVGGFGSTGLV